MLVRLKPLIKDWRTNLYSHQHASVLVPAQQRVLSTPCFRVLNIRPAVHEFLVACDLGQLSCDGTVHILDDIEVGREKDIEVPLVDLYLNVSRLQTTPR